MLPNLDVSSYLNNPNGTDAERFVELLRDTCHGPGFFYLTGHGISSDFSDAALAIAEQFFALPDKEREALAIGNSAAFRGYCVLRSNVTAHSA